MKLYHKFFLYQNKWIHPYIRVALGVMTALTYLASILLIVGLVYEHGFTISAAEAHQLQRLYHGVWIVFLVDISLHILLEYKDTRQTFSMLTWILTFLLYLTLVPVIFHRPEVGRRRAGSLGFSERQGLSSCIAAGAVFPESVVWTGTVAGATDKPFAYPGGQFLHYHTHRDRVADASPFYGGGHLVGGFAVYFHQCGVCDGTDFGRRGIHFHDNGFCNHHSADSDWRSGGDDADKFLRDVLHGEYLFV